MKSTIKNKVLFVLALLFGLMFINGGLDKFFHYMPPQEGVSEKMIKAFGALMELSWLMPLVGFAEVVGGVLIIFPRTRALGALIIFPVMVGIILMSIFQNTSALPIVVVLNVILGWVIYENRNKYLNLMKK
jgi:uncharacterized membrane protein YphA (DoxX/SURF4 family)